ncbi:MAG: mechanosensitive ion channel family protein [Chloroflexota bacterium]|nr:mechanosensitive ion channel family protein [Chloroflexota bacterium]
MLATPLRIVLIGLVFIVALVIGLLLRRRLVERMKKNTELDAWLIQTLGVLVVLPLPLIAALASPIIYLWSVDTLPQQVREVTSIPLVGQIASLVGQVGGSILLIALGLGVARTMRNVTIRSLETNRIDINIRTLIGRIFFIAILLLTAFWLLSIWHIPLEFPVAAISIVTVLITVAIQDILKDLVAGFYILVERPFFISQIISTATYTGKVENIELRATKLRLVSGEEITIPNSLVFGGIVVNNSFYSERRASVDITLPQEKFVRGETKQQIVTAVGGIEHVMEKPEPDVVFSTYIEQKITLTLHFWIETGQPEAVTDVMFMLHTALPDADLTVKEFAGNI